MRMMFSIGSLAAVLVLPAAADEGGKRSAAEWVGRLAETDEASVRKAQEALVARGPGAVPALLQALEAPDTRVRRVLIETLSRLGPHAKDAAPALIHGLEDPDPRVRRGCAAALGSVQADIEDAVPALRGRLKDGEAGVREMAVDALGSFGEASMPAVPDLVVAMKDPDGIVADRAAGSLERLGPLARAGLPEFTAMLKGEDVRLRARVIPVLGALGDASVAPDLERIAGAAGPGREPVIAALAALHRAPDLVLGYVLELLEKDPFPGPCPEEIMRRLVEDLGSAAKEGAPGLAAKLAAADVRTREAAIRILGWIGPDAGEAMPALRKLADDPEVGKLATVTLGRIDPNNPNNFYRRGSEKTTPDTVLDLRPGLADRAARIPPATLRALPDLLATLGRLQEEARKKPGSSREGNAALGQGRVYEPSDEELLVSETGGRIAEVVAHTSRSRLEPVLQEAFRGVPTTRIEYGEIRISHVDAIGSGRFFEALPPAPREVLLLPAKEAGAVTK